MTRPLAWITSLLRDVGAREEFIGDLLEEYASGRTRLWYVWQVLSAVWLLSLRQIGAHRTRACGTVMMGWATLLFVFFIGGDRTANALAGWLWNWDRQTAYSTGHWWPFQIMAACVSYAGFALSAVAVVRLNRRHAAAMLVAYTASVFTVLAVSSVVLEILTRRNGAVPVPHTLFYIVSVTLPFHWRSGLLLAPAIVLIAGLLASTGHDLDHPEPKPV